jgi:hypothetical protein
MNFNTYPPTVGHCQHERHVQPPTGGRLTPVVNIAPVGNVDRLATPRR